MYNGIKDKLRSKIILAPEWIWNSSQRIIRKLVQPQTMELLAMERYAEYLMASFEDAWVQVEKNRKCMIIESGEYGYSYFNVAYVNNVVTLIFYSMYKGCIPVIRINQDNPKFNKWDWYFSQPHTVMGTDITGFEEVPCDITNHVFRPEMQMIHTPHCRRYRLFQMLFRRFVRLNEKTEQYVRTEIRDLGDVGQVLGVLLRGTDYVKLKPKGHPVQPEPEEIIRCAAQRFARDGFMSVYVATEEKRLYEMMSDAVGNENTRQNKRQYYDDLYYKSNTDLIGKVHFEREDDNYWKGLEYLSSLMLLSKCKTLIAGNCGGTLFAVLMADYEAPQIFNYGVY